MEGFDLARIKALQVLEDIKITEEMNRERLISVANTSLRTKVNPKLADCLTEVSYFILLKFNLFDRILKKHKFINIYPKELIVLSISIF